MKHGALRWCVAACVLYCHVHGLALSSRPPPRPRRPSAPSPHRNGRGTCATGAIRRGGATLKAVARDGGGGGRRGGRGGRGGGGGNGSGVGGGGGGDDGGPESGGVTRRAALLFPAAVLVGANLPFLSLMASPPNEEDLDESKAQWCKVSLASEWWRGHEHGSVHGHPSGRVPSLEAPSHSVAQRKLPPFPPSAHPPNLPPPYPPAYGTHPWPHTAE